MAITILLSGTMVAQQSPQVEEAIALAKRTLAERLSVPVESLRVIASAPMEWRDSSLGCPERGMVYTPALMSGYKVTLRAGQRTHAVHVAAGHAIVCGAKDDPKLSPAPLVAATLKAADMAKKAAAEDLQVDESHIRVVSSRPAYAEASACPGAPDARKGAAFLVDIEAGGHAHRYYVDDATAVRCEEKSQRGKDQRAKSKRPRS